MQRLLAHFYADSADAVPFRDQQQEDADGKSGNWDKLKSSLSKNLPKDLMDTVPEGQAMRSSQSLAQAQVQQQALAHFWAFLSGLLVPT